MLKKIFCILISFLCIGFIFFNSSQDGAVSHGRSYYIVNRIIDILKEDDIANNSNASNNSNINEGIYIEDSNKSNMNSANSSIGDKNNLDNKSSMDNIINKFSIINKFNIKDKLISKIRNVSFIKNMTKNELDHLIRKFAHGFEFALLGLALCLLFSIFNIKKYNVIIYSLFLVLFTAVVDETIQLKIPNRGSSTKDVLIDFCGGIVSCILFYFFKVSIFKSKTKRRKSIESKHIIQYKKIQS